MMRANFRKGPPLVTLWGVIRLTVLVTILWGVVRFLDGCAAERDAEVKGRENFEASWIQVHRCHRSGFAGKYAEFEVFTCADGNSYRREDMK